MEYGGYEVVLPFPGRHQAMNASMAIEIALALWRKGYEITDEQIIAGLEQASFPARIEVLRRQPLLLLDGSVPLDQQDEEAMAVAESAPHRLVVVNKSDLPCVLDKAALEKRFGSVLAVSAKTGAGMAALCEAIGALYPTGAEPQGELLTNARQADAVRRALSCVKNAHASLQFGMTPDVVLTDAEGALEALGELSGKHIREDLVDTIFSRFCVGK